MGTTAEVAGPRQTPLAAPNWRKRDIYQSPVGSILEAGARFQDPRLGILTHQTCRCIPRGPWSRRPRGFSAVTAGEEKLSEQLPEAPYL